MKAKPHSRFVVERGTLMKNKATRPPGTTSHCTQALNCVVILTLIALTSLAEADPLDTWTVGYQLPTDNPSLADVSAIAYGNGQFVAVGDGAILTSVGGAHWVQRQSLAETGLNSIYAMIYVNGLFWAVGSNADPSGFIATSADGLNWSQDTTLANPALNATVVSGKVVCSMSIRAVCARRVRANASGPTPTSRPPAWTPAAWSASRHGPSVPRSLGLRQRPS